MKSRIEYKERHNFFTIKEYLCYAGFLVILNIKELVFANILILNLIASIFYFALISLFLKRDVSITKNMIKQGNIKLPMKAILHLAHTGTYLYFVFNSRKYIKIYDPDKALTKLIIANYKELNLPQDSLKLVCWKSINE